jgi:hypothetical protein
MANLLLPLGGTKQVKTIGLLLIALIGLGGEATALAQAPARHLVYEFGYNTPVASQGQGTGTTTVDISGPAADGGLMISGTDYWWNTARPRATNTCEVYANGRVNCAQRPYAISPMQLTIFPLLAHSYFKGLTAHGTSSWERTYTVYAAVLPGASGMAGSPNTWNCSYTLHGKGPLPNAAPAVLVETTGTLVQQGGHYLKATSKQRIAYDPLAKIPVVVRDVRTHIPQVNVYNNDLIELKLKTDSQSK